MRLSPLRAGADRRGKAEIDFGLGLIRGQQGTFTRQSPAGRTRSTIHPDYISPST